MFIRSEVIYRVYHLKINGITEVVKWWNGCDSVSRIAMFVASNSEDDSSTPRR
jgi:hypothetical protein